MMKLKHLTVIFIMLCLFSKAFGETSPAGAEASSAVENSENSTETPAAEGTSDSATTGTSDSKLIMEGYPDELYTHFLQSSDLILQLTPGFYLNPYASELHSGPSAPIYLITIGFIWPDYTRFALQPSLSFFYMYNGWYDGKAYPFENENRTARTLCFMIDVPAVLSIYAGSNKIEFSAGFDVLARFSTLAPHVNESDSGGSGSAGEDVKLINKWFWQGGRFLYAKAGICWQHELTNAIKGGPLVNFYLPIGSLINSEGLLGAIINLGFKLTF